MTAVISTELFKLRTTRAPWVTVATLAAVVGGILAANAALLGKPGQPTLAAAMLGDFARGPGRLVGAVALLLGILMTTSEYRHATALTTRLGYPRVPGLVLGKAAAAALVGVVLAVAVEAVMLAGGAILLGSHHVAAQPLQHGVPAAVLGVVVVTALHAIAGVGIGELLRNPALAVGVVFGWAFVVEGILPMVLRKPHLDRWLPGGAIHSALSTGLPHDRTILLPAAGLALLAAYAVGLLVAGFARTRLTDP